MLVLHRMERIGSIAEFRTQHDLVRPRAFQQETGLQRLRAVTLQLHALTLQKPELLQPAQDPLIEQRHVLLIDRHLIGGLDPLRHLREKHFHFPAEILAADIQPVSLHHIEMLFPAECNDIPVQGHPDPAGPGPADTYGKLRLTAADQKVAFPPLVVLRLQPAARHKLEETVPPDAAQIQFPDRRNRRIQIFLKFQIMLPVGIRQLQHHVQKLSGILRERAAAVVKRQPLAVLHEGAPLHGRGKLYQILHHIPAAAAHAKFHANILAADQKPRDQLHRRLLLPLRDAGHLPVRVLADHAAYLQGGGDRACRILLRTVQKIL